jgi:hypothetical protein
MVGNYPFPLCGGRLGPALQYTVCRQILVPTPTLPHRGGGKLFEGDTHEISTPISPRGVSKKRAPARSHNSHKMSTDTL